MKKVIYLFFILFGIFSFSQEDYKKKLGQDACKCLNELKIENQSKEMIQMQVGLCFLKVATPYKEEIKKDYGIDVSKDFADEKKMEILGEKLAFLMISECGDTFLKIMEKSGITEEVMKENTTEEITADLLMHGEVAKIDKDAFVIFYLKGDNGILTKFYWVSNVESNIELEKKYNELVGKKVNVSYYSTDIFDYKISEYRKVNILTMLKTE